MRGQTAFGLNWQFGYRNFEDFIAHRPSTASRHVLLLTIFETGRTETPKEISNRIAPTWITPYRSHPAKHHISGTSLSRGVNTTNQPSLLRRIECDTRPSSPNPIVFLHSWPSSSSYLACGTTLSSIIFHRGLRYENPLLHEALEDSFSV